MEDNVQKKALLLTIYRNMLRYYLTYITTNPKVIAYSDEEFNELINECVKHFEKSDELIIDINAFIAHDRFVTTILKEIKL